MTSETFFSDHCPLVIARTRGGLGNQLFILAAGVLLTEALKVRLWVDEYSGFARDVFERVPQSNQLVSDVHILPLAITQMVRVAVKCLPPAMLCRLGVLRVTSEVSLAEIIVAGAKPARRWLIVLDGYFQGLPLLLDESFSRAAGSRTFSNAALFLKPLAILGERQFGAIHLRLNWGMVPAEARSALELPKEYFSWSFLAATRLEFISRWIVFTDCRKTAECVLEGCEFSKPYQFADDLGLLGDVAHLYGLASAQVLVLSNSTFSWWAGTCCLRRGGIVFSPPMERYGQLCSAPIGAIVWNTGS
jgi:hypothetical protein